MASRFSPWPQAVELDTSGALQPTIDTLDAHVGRVVAAQMRFVRPSQ